MRTPTRMAPAIARSCALLFLVLLTCVQCREAKVEPPPLSDADQISLARQWFEEHLQATASGARRGTGKKARWEEAFTIRGKSVVVPLSYEDTTNSSIWGYNRLLLTPEKDGKYQSRILQFIPNLTYLEQNDYHIKETDYTGILLAYDWEGRAAGGWLSANGTITGTVNEEKGSASGRMQGCVTYSVDWFQTVRVGGSTSAPIHLGTNNYTVCVESQVQPKVTDVLSMLSGGGGGGGSEGGGSTSGNTYEEELPCEGEMTGRGGTCRTTTRIIAVVNDPTAPTAAGIAAGPRPMREFANKCTGVQAMWATSAANNQERIGFVTENGGLIETHQGSFDGIPVDGLVNHNGRVYYQYEQPVGDPLPTWPGTVANPAGLPSNSGMIRVYIPVVASVHTHNPCLTDGTNGASHPVSDDDHTMASSFPGINHYIVGCAAVAQYNSTNTSYYNVTTGALSTTCNTIN